MGSSGSRAGGQLGNPDLPILRPNCTAAATQPADLCTALQRLGSNQPERASCKISVFWVMWNPLGKQSFRLLTFFFT